ncbi:MAG: hypothetical protein WC732_00480 [Candidatus Omnitrophota bacterium]
MQSLSGLDPEKLSELSEKKVLNIFQTAAARVPAYKEILAQAGLDAASIKTIDDFKKRVPVLDKEKTFGTWNKNDIRKLCMDGRIEDVHVIVASSGHTGLFSYGLNTYKELERSQRALDFVLDTIFNVSGKKTLLVNCLAMGVHVASPLVSVVDTSVRPDIVIEVVKTFSHCYEQTIIVGENSFVKKVLEDGAEAGVDWTKVRPHLVLGEEVLAENMRTYFSGLLEIDPDNPETETMIGSSFGIAEFGLNLFYETKDLIRLRRLMQKDEKLREALIGLDLGNLPAILQYNPTKIFVEELPTNDGLFQLALTNLEEEAVIPLIRYNTKDEGIHIPYEKLQKTLKDFSYEEFLPQVKLPIMAIWGRGKIRVNEGFSIRPEFIKELLYRKRDIACSITGNFRLSKSRAGLRIEIQAKEKTARCVEFENKLRALFLENIPARIEIIIYPYHEFPHGMELNYERKFRYVE